MSPAPAAANRTPLAPTRPRPSCREQDDALRITLGQDMAARPAQPNMSARAWLQAAGELALLPGVLLLLVYHIPGLPGAVHMPFVDWHYTCVARIASECCPLARITSLSLATRCSRSSTPRRQWSSSTHASRYSLATCSCSSLGAIPQVISTYLRFVFLFPLPSARTPRTRAPFSVGRSSTGVRVWLQSDIISRSAF